MAEPVINNIVAIGFVYQWKPLVAGKGDKENTAVVWYIVFYRHVLKITKCGRFLRLVVLTIDATSLPALFAWLRDVAGNLLR